MSKLLDFLTDLATNPQKQKAFGQTPAALMDAAGLSEADKAALSSGDKTKISALDEFCQLAYSAIDPAPDPLPDPDPSPPAEPRPDSEPPESAIRVSALAV